MLKGVIFDMDGTMFDSERIWREMWLQLPKEYGRAGDPGLGVDICGTSGEHMLSAIRKHFPDLDAREFSARGMCRYRERILQAQPPEKPGLYELVEYLRGRGLLLAVASGSEQDVIEQNLKRGGLSEAFSAVISGHSVPNGKPAPDIFLESAKHLGLAPEECMVIEDGENGIRAAATAGCIPVMIPDLTQPCPEVRAVCRAVLPTMYSLLEALQKGEIF